jgi:hypothetical protein
MSQFLPPGRFPFGPGYRFGQQGSEQLKHRTIIAKNVTENLFERHMKPLLLGE